jgi:hypothetical protein
MELKDLKQGDKLRFMFGRDFVTATVLENFPVQQRIRVAMKNGITQIFRYSAANFDLWNILEPEKHIIKEKEPIAEEKKEEAPSFFGTLVWSVATIIEIAMER